MDDLKARYPDVTFIHVTAPFGPWIAAQASGLGKCSEVTGANRAKLANASRNEFNRRLKEKYAGDPIFDLAEVMSTYPNGRRESFRMNGAVYLQPGAGCITDDGGHLNRVGRTYAAAALMRSIADVLRAQQGALINN